MPDEGFEAIIIGAGQSGGPLAGACARAGRRTALIERAHVGGTCINYGCTPTKTMVASARIAHLARRASDYGVGTGDITVDMGAVRARKAAIVRSFRAQSEGKLESAGVELIRGDAHFVGPRMLEVRDGSGATRTVAADVVFINTGGRPARPRVAGVEAVRALDSTSIMELDDVPAHLLVLGGGYIGVEFAQMFRRFGSDVTVLQRAGQLLTREDEDVAEAVAAVLREDGIEVLLSTTALAVDPDGNGGVRIRLASPQGKIVRTGSHLLIAAGRVPNTEGLGLDVAGVETDAEGFIRVNARLETSSPGVYAMGDVKGGPAFTHISYDDYRILRANLIDRRDATTEGRLVPYTVFMDPQLGRVGLSEAQAIEAGHQIRVAKLPMTHVARAIEMDETRGFMKAVIDANTDRVLGCAVLAVEGGELMSLLQVAIMTRLPYRALRDGIFAHPTLAEAFNNLFRESAWSEPVPATRT